MSEHPLCYSWDLQFMSARIIILYDVTSWPPGPTSTLNYKLYMCLPMFPCHFIGNLRVFLLTQFCYVANKMLVQSEVALFAMFGTQWSFLCPFQSKSVLTIHTSPFLLLWTYLVPFGHFWAYWSFLHPFRTISVLFWSIWIHASPFFSSSGHIWSSLVSDPKKTQIFWYISRLISQKAINLGHYSWLWSPMRPLLLLTGIVQQGPHSESNLDLFCWLGRKPKI